MGSQRHTGIVVGSVSAADTRAHVQAHVRLSGTSFATDSDVRGNYTIPSVPFGSYRLECHAADFEPFIAERVVVAPHRPAVQACILARRLKPKLDEPVVLLPLRLEIYRQDPGADTPVARYQLQPNPPAPLASLTSETTGRPWEGPTREYWVRWYPDDIHFPVPVGRFTAKDLTAWSKFRRAVQAELESTAAASGGLDSLPSGVNPTLLQIRDGLYPGLLTEAGLLVNGSNTTPYADFVNASNRPWLEWQQTENPKLMHSWRQLVEAVGPVRARQLARHFTPLGAPRGGFEFDSLFPLRLDGGFVSELDVGLVSYAFRMALEARVGGPVSASIRLTVVREHSAWKLEDRAARRIYVAERRGGDLVVHGAEEADPMALVLTRGIELPTLPDRLCLYAYTEGQDPVLVKDVSVHREHIRVSAVEIEPALWLTDFERAVALGMGCRVTDADAVSRIDGADWLFAVGLRTGMASREVLGDLLRRHNARGELALVPQDSPTTNTEEGGSSYAEQEMDPIAMLRATRTRTDVPPASADGFIPLVPDTARLAHALAVDPDVLSEIRGSDLVEQEEAEAMARLLWPPCTALFATFWKQWFASPDGANGQMLQVLNHWTNLGEYFALAVRARGPFPVVRVGDQPYGVLPVMSSRGLDLTTPFPTSDFPLPEWISEFTGFLRPEFLEWSKRAPRLGEAADDQLYETFLSILQQNPVSNQLDARPFTLEDRFSPADDPRNIVCPLVLESSETGGAPNVDYLGALEELWFGSGSSSSGDPADASNLLVLHPGSPVLKRILLLMRTLWLKPDSRWPLPPLKAIRLVRSLPPAKIAILLMEILDLLSHRLDAWITSPATVQLAKLREGKPSGSSVGVYGWIEKPGHLQTRSQPSVFLQAPSMAQAATAALMFNAAENSGDEAAGGAYHVDLSSARVRFGEWYLSNLRQQHLPGELLGAYLQEVIQDWAISGVGGVGFADISDLRSRYPLTLQQAKDGDGAPTESPTVIDGKRFLETNTDDRYAGLRDQLGFLLDAASDLAIWEAVDQAMQGNHAAAAAWFDFLAGKALPPELRSIHTRRNGDRHGTRIFLPLLFPDAARTPTDATRPRYVADPLLAQWCAALMNGCASAQIAVIVRPQGGGSERQVIATLADLDLTPLDLLVGGRTELAMRARYFVAGRWQASDPADVSSPYYPLGPYPALGSQADPLSSFGSSLELDSDDPSGIGRWLERAELLVKLLHGQRSSQRIAPILPDEVSRFDQATRDDVDPVATLSELVARLRSLLRLQGGTLAAVVMAAWSVRIQHVARAWIGQLRAEYRAVAALRATQASDSPDAAVAAAIATMRSGFDDLFSIAPELNGLLLGLAGFGKNMLASDSAPNNPNPTTWESLPEKLDDTLDSLRLRYETTIAATTAAAIPQIQALMPHVSRFGGWRALTPLPASPTYSDSVALLGLLDTLVAEIVHKASSAATAAGDYVVALEAIGAIFQDPDAYDGADRDTTAAGPAVYVQQLKVSKATAQFLWDRRSSGSATRLSGSLTSISDILEANAGAISITLQSQEMTAPYFQAMERVLKEPIAVRDILSASPENLAALGASPYEIDESVLPAIVALDLPSLDPFRPEDIGRVVLKKLSPHIAGALALLQGLTDQDAFPLLTPFFRTKTTGAFDGSRPLWALNLAGVTGQYLPGELEPFRPVRKLIDCVLRVFGTASGIRVYHEAFVQRPDPRGGDNRPTGSIDLVYLAHPAATSGTCFAGILADQWQEGRPNRDQLTGVAIRHASPRNQAPNAILVAVPAKVDPRAEWTPELLCDVLRETTEQVRIRLVDSHTVRTSEMGHFLPALLFPPLRGDSTQSPPTPDTTLFPLFSKLLHAFDVSSKVLFVPAEALTAEERNAPGSSAVRSPSGNES